VLPSRGVGALTIDDILEAAGVARATFYAHFSDKNDVIREIVADMWRRATDLYARFAAIPVADEASVREWLDYACARWRKHHREVISLLREMPLEIDAATGRHLDEFVAIMIADGRHWRCPRDEAACRARLLIVQLERAMLDMARGTWPTSQQRLVDTLLGFWMNALRAP
jgi:AcrR family transcriptional regulator